MNKGLDLQIIRNMRPDLADLFQRQLSGRYHPLGTQLMPEQIGLIIGIVCLGTDMALNLRTDSLSQS